MRISVKQRHERAENFRDMVSAREYGIPGKIGSFVDIDDVISELLDRRVCDSEVAVDACEALGIADLIDRPTCHLVEDKDGRTACSECGCTALYLSDATYCPDCGAVIADAEH